MRVKMILDLIANTKGAKQAQKDVKGVKDAAKSLDGTRAGQRISRDFLNLASTSKKASRGVKDTKTAADALGTSSGPKKLGRDFLDLSKKAKAAGRDIDQVKRKAAQAQAARGQARKPASAAGREAKDGGTTLFGGTKALVGGYLGIQGVRMAGRATVGQSISFEKAMAEVRKKVDGMDDPAELAKMEKAVSKWAIAYGRAREEVASLVAEAGAGGISLKDMPEFVRINLAAATAWDATADKTSNALAKIRAATQWGNPQLEEFVDKVNALADAGSAKEMDVVDMFQRAGAAAKAAGVDFDTSLAFLTAMNNVAIAPEVAARGFNAFASTLRTATEQQNRVDEGLKMIGLSAKKVEKGMKANSLGTMMDVLDRIEKSADKAKVAIKVFGREWWDEVARAGQALPEIRKNLDIVNDPKKWKGSAQGNLNIQLSLTATHLERLKALTSDVGDRLGRWALPAINEGIEKIIAGMDEIERRQDKLREGDSVRDKAGKDRVLTAEERARLADDPALAADAQRRRDHEADNIARNSNIRDKAVSDPERVQLEALRSRIDGEIAKLQAEMDAIRKRSRDEGAIARPIAELERKQIDARRRRDDVDTAIRRKDPAPLGSADKAAREAERAELVKRREEVNALRAKVVEAEARVNRLESLAAAATNPENRKGFLEDRAPHVIAGNQALSDLSNKVAPNATAAGRFGFGPGGAPASAKGKGAGPGLKSFTPSSDKVQGKGWKGGSAAGWAKSLIGLGDVDLGDIGITIAESLAQGLRSGSPGVSTAASGLGEAARSALGSVDLTAAGRQAGDSFASGLLSSRGAVAAAARRLADSAGGRQSLSGALHDGVE